MEYMPYKKDTSDGPSVFIMPDQWIRYQEMTTTANHSLGERIVRIVVTYYWQTLAPNHVLSYSRLYEIFDTEKHILSNDEQYLLSDIMGRCIAARMTKDEFLFLYWELINKLQVYMNAPTRHNTQQKHINETVVKLMEDVQFLNQRCIEQEQVQVYLAEIVKLRDKIQELEGTVNVVQNASCNSFIAQNRKTLEREIGIEDWSSGLFWAFQCKLNPADKPLFFYNDASLKYFLQALQTSANPHQIQLGCEISVKNVQGRVVELGWMTLEGIYCLWEMLCEPRFAFLPDALKHPWSYPINGGKRMSDVPRHQALDFAMKYIRENFLGFMVTGQTVQSLSLLSYNPYNNLIEKHHDILQQLLKRIIKTDTDVAIHIEMINWSSTQAQDLLHAKTHAILFSLPEEGVDELDFMSYKQNILFLYNPHEEESSIRINASPIVSNFNTAGGEDVIAGLAE